MDVERLNQAGGAILQVLESQTYGWANAEALREITRLANEALSASDHHSDVAEKVASIKAFSAILYSARKHRAYDAGARSGADVVHSFILADASRLA